jgi:ABC-type branched-subunit amino acid transport system substrate-binding protein
MINPFAALTYDATLALAYGLDAVLGENWDLTGDNLKKVMFHNTSFDGASGKGDFDINYGLYGTLYPNVMCSNLMPSPLYA